MLRDGGLDRLLDLPDNELWDLIAGRAGAGRSRVAVHWSRAAHGARWQPRRTSKSRQRPIGWRSSRSAAVKPATFNILSMEPTS